jgi:hypothetical protein
MQLSRTMVKSSWQYRIRSVTENVVFRRIAQASMLYFFIRDVSASVVAATALVGQCHPSHRRRNPLLPRHPIRHPPISYLLRRHQPTNRLPLPLLTPSNRISDLSHPKRLHVLIYYLPISLRREICLVIDAHISMLSTILIPPGPTLAVDGRVRKGVEVLHGLPVGKSAGSEGT